MGRQQTEETKRKISEVLKGRKPTSGGFQNCMISR